MSVVLSCLLAAQIGLGAVLTGRVQREERQEPVASILVELEPTTLNAVTDSSGYFVIRDIPPGAYKVTFSGPGCRPLARDILAIGDSVIVLDIRLREEPIPVREVVVSGEREEERRADAGTLAVNQLALDRMPRILEGDLFRSLSILPGVVTTSDFSSAPFVRGGNADQNLVLLDGVNVYNPTHLVGLFSIFEPDAIGAAELMAGGFPAEYGGRLSSVLDVRTRDGNSERLTGSVGTSILASRVLVEGPFRDEPAPPPESAPDQPSGTYLFAARRSYFDRVLSLLGYDLPFNFYDILGKMRFSYGPNTHVGLTGFLSGDQLDVGKGQDRTFADWGTALGHLQWEQSWSPRLFMSTGLSYSNYHYDVDVPWFYETKMNDTIGEWNLKSKLTWSLNANNELDGGVDAGLSRFRFLTDVFHTYRFNVAGSPLSVSPYVQARLQPIAGLVVEPGLRLDHYELMDTDFTHYWRLNPRLALKYSLNEITAIKGSVGRYYQYESALFPEDSPIPGLFFWVPLFAQAEPQQADQVILGAERWLNENVRLTVEGYYKNYGRVYEMASNPDPAQIATLLQPETGYSYGADALLAGEWGPLTGWLSYSLGYARVKYTAHAWWGDESYDVVPAYDRRHLFNIVLSYRLPAGIALTARWCYGTGFPYTDTIYRYRVWGYDDQNNGYYYHWISVPGSPNGARYPDYHRLDIGVERSFRVGRTQLELQLEVINAYDRKNVMFYQWEDTGLADWRKPFYQLPILPSLGLKWKF